MSSSPCTLLSTLDYPLHFALFALFAHSLPPPPFCVALRSYMVLATIALLRLAHVLLVSDLGKRLKEFGNKKAVQRVLFLHSAVSVTCGLRAAALWVRGGISGPFLFLISLFPSSLELAVFSYTVVMWYCFCLFVNLVSLLWSS